MSDENRSPGPCRDAISERLPAEHVEQETDRFPFTEVSRCKSALEIGHSEMTSELMLSKLGNATLVIAALDEMVPLVKDNASGSENEVSAVQDDTSKTVKYRSDGKDTDCNAALLITFNDSASAAKGKDTFCKIGHP